MNTTRSCLAVALLLSATATVRPETIDISIGHQSMCTDTYTAGIVVKELKLIDKHLPRDGKYAGATYNITWSD
ncbi:MAG TPA: sulfonate ABC transporter substrate-binding protein, partial [Xanthobacteraceae bacterium]|nr:sulfonate ABC transporter substrate-binding protein [Xanthobacteraceae bacterium]